MSLETGAPQMVMSPFAEVQNAPPATTQRSYPVTQGFGIRAVAYVIDNVIMVAAAAASFIVTAVVVMVIRELQGQTVPDFPSASSLADWVMSALVTVSYFGLFEWLLGATPGKLILRLRVVQVNGMPCRLGPAVVRGIARFVDGLFFALPALISMRRSNLNQRRGDHWAATLVVSADDPFIAARRPAWGGVLAALLFLLLTETVMGLFMLLL